MGTAKKKVAKNPKVSSSLAKEPRPKQAQATEALRRERDEALEQLAAAGDILRLIARSPTDLQTVLYAISENAAKLCDAADAGVWRVEGDLLAGAAHFGSIPLATAPDQPITRDNPASRAVFDRQTIHVHDLQGAEAEFPLSKTYGIAAGLRTVLATPLLRNGTAIGAILIRRTQVRPFTERQIKLLETFADQAVIAIENVGLFNELDARNRQLTESVEQQTATSEILGVISSSPTDLQPVFDTIARGCAT